MNLTTSCPLFCRPADVIQFHHDNEANGRGQNARGMKDEMMMNPGRCPFLRGGHETYAGATEYSHSRQCITKLHLCRKWSCSRKTFDQMQSRMVLTVSRSIAEFQEIQRQHLNPVPNCDDCIQSASFPSAYANPTAKTMLPVSTLQVFPSIGAMVSSKCDSVLLMVSLVKPQVLSRPLTL